MKLSFLACRIWWLIMVYLLPDSELISVFFDTQKLISKSLFHTNMDIKYTLPYWLSMYSSSSPFGIDSVISLAPIPPTYSSVSPLASLDFCCSGIKGYSSRSIVIIYVEEMWIKVGIPKMSRLPFSTYLALAS